MRDTWVTLHCDRVRCAKNGNREPDEARLLEWQSHAHAPSALTRRFGILQGLAREDGRQLFHCFGRGFSVA